MEDNDDVSPLDRDHCLSVVLPGGQEERTVTAHGSKPVMDLLVSLCASHHLNPSDYTVEILSANRNSVGFKPNSLIGSLDAQKIVLKPKQPMEEKSRRPYTPEASVRLLVNYRRSHKTVVRVNPRVPLEVLLPNICTKCEFHLKTTVLLRDGTSGETLDLAKTLDDLGGLREVYARDTAAVTPPEIIAPPLPQGLVEVTNQPKKKEKKEKKEKKDDKGFLSLFRRKKKKTDSKKDVSASAPPSPGGACPQRGGGTLPADLSKKRRAPQPPMGAFHSVPNDLGSAHLHGAEISDESSLRRRIKRLAPLPPCAPPPPCAHLESCGQTAVKDSGLPLDGGD